MSELDELLPRVRACTLCAEFLPKGPRPVVQASDRARILIAGQAPGRKVHASGKPFDDASGDRLRDWLGVSRDEFYDPTKFAILPMGFCYPGTGSNGDLPPRPECAPTWRAELLRALPQLEFTVAIGQYAIRWHMPKGYKSVTAAAQDWSVYWPGLLATPHPSPRNNLWLRRNPWFEDEVVPQLRRRVRELLTAAS
ncbi:uracil-DNA glycosylase family protein [Aliidiomarina sp. Khilg15.8]